MTVINEAEAHIETEKPRLSSFLILLISGLVSFGVSFFSSWLPGANGRFGKPLAYTRKTLFILADLSCQMMSPGC